MRRESERLGDRHPTRCLKLIVTSDGDIYIVITDRPKGLPIEGDKDRAEIQFSTIGAGGGNSENTRIALIKLMDAIDADNRVTPNS